MATIERDASKKDPVIVVLQLSGGNDYLNTVIPYTDGPYRDSRPVVGIPEDQVLAIDGNLGFNPAMAALKEMYEIGRAHV